MKAAVTHLEVADKLVLFYLRRLISS